jgi:hypothetical protein
LVGLVHLYRLAAGKLAFQSNIKYLKWRGII